MASQAAATLQKAELASSNCKNHSPHRRAAAPGRVRFSLEPLGSVPLLGMWWTLATDTLNSSVSSQIGAQRMHGLLTRTEREQKAQSKVA
eukprot:4602768-Amphidinium_carterae.2